MQTWYVAKTKPTKERFVESFLSEIWEIEVFLPVIRRPGGKKPNWEPLFPTYLFCHIDRHAPSWPDVRWAPGLCYFLGAGDELSPVSPDFIARLKQRVSRWNEGGYLSHFLPGDRVFVTNGPFSGLEGIFQKYVPARQRCQVLLQVVGSVNNVEIPIETIKATSGYQRFAVAV
jgi:transcriptional antiterminator RfaH